MGAETGADFGELGYGISQTPQVWIDCQVMERRGSLGINWDVRVGVFPEGLIEDMFAPSTPSSGESPATTRCGMPVPSCPHRRRRSRPAARPPVRALRPPTRCCTRQSWSAKRGPERIAVVDSTRSMTYDELLARAGGVAAHVADAGRRVRGDRGRRHGQGLGAGRGRARRRSAPTPLTCLSTLISRRPGATKSSRTRKCVTCSRSRGSSRHVNGLGT